MENQADNYLDNHFIHKSNWLRAAVLGANCPVSQRYCF